MFRVFPFTKRAEHDMFIEQLSSKMFYGECVIKFAFYKRKIYIDVRL